jgi:hypothetical protein
VCDQLGIATAQDKQLLEKNRSELQQVRAQVEQRKKTAQEQAQQQGGPQGQQGDQVVLEGQNFNKLASGWYSNEGVVGNSNQVRWSGNSNVQAPAGPGQAQGETWTLVVPEGTSLDLKNAEVFAGQQGQQGQGQQQAQHGYGQQAQQNAPQQQRRMLQNKGYDQAEVESQLEQAKQQLQEANALDGEDSLRQLDAFRRIVREREQAGRPANSEETRRELEELMKRYRQPLGEQGATDADKPVTALGEVHGDRAGAWGGDRGRGAETTGGRFTTSASEGLMSIAVSFDTPGRALHFASDTQETPKLVFTTYPEGTGESAGKAGRGLVLLVLLAGLVRLGLHRPIAGRGAVQGLLLLAAGGLAVATFAHMAGAVAALAAGLWAVRHGALFRA